MADQSHLRPDHVSIVIGQWNGPPGLGDWTGDLVSISTEGPDGIGASRDEIRRALDSATLPNDRTLDESWSEFDWGASGPVGLVIEVAIAIGLEQAILHLVSWFKNNTEPSLAIVASPEEAIDTVRTHLAKYHDLKDLEIVSCEGASEFEWSIVGRSASRTYDITLSTDHLLVVRVSRRN